MNGIELNESVINDIAKAMWNSHCSDTKWDDLDKTIDAGVIDEIKIMAGAAIKRYLVLVECSEIGL